MNLESPAGKPEWKLVDSPTRPDCVPDESQVPVNKTVTGISFVRTPEKRFANLPGYPFDPHYSIVEGLRMHYVDEGSAAGEVVLLLHGQPSWSYLYRKMIPPIAAAGYRVIGVDHIGMGRSDKPVELSFHTFEKHVARLKAFIETLDLKDITLFCQDWGSLMGLRVAGDQPERFARIVVANGTLPVIPKGMNPFRVPNPVQIDCSLGDFSRPADLSPASWQAYFQRWIIFALTAPNFTSSQIVQGMTMHQLTQEEKAAYDAPYPSLIYKAAVRTFPSMVAAIEDQNFPAWQALGEYKKPFLFLAGEHDPNMGSAANQERMTSHIPGAKGQPHERFEAAGHFIQEDIGEILAAKVISFLAANPIRKS
jgi:haloalkane dehalogenase